MSAPLTPVLLLGAGTGEATCGILYLGSYLRRHDLEAYVRLQDSDETEAELEHSLEALLAHVKPKLVGISLKWFHHVARAKQMAAVIKRLDPTVKIALGGNSASFWWKELLQWPEVDFVVLGDGEGPLMSLARGDENPPNVLARGATSATMQYVQGTSSSDVYYSHFDQLFLSGLDAASYSGWVQPGKGCGENCLYCSGTRGMQKATFGRAKPFLRPEASVQKDHREIVGRTWQLRYDFAGSTAEFLERTWGSADLTHHAITYFLWGVPPKELAPTLSRRFDRVYMVLDVGCFSESQRIETMRRGLLKPCPTNRALLQTIEQYRQHANLELEISGIAGLPYASERTLKEERELVEQVLELGCSIGYQRLESQPGALVTEHPDRFEMRSEATSFDEFLHFFEQRDDGDRSVPMLRYADAAFERKVQRTSDEVDAMVWDAAARRREVTLTPRTKLRDASVARERHGLRDWLGAFRVPAKLAGEQVTVVRSLDGTGLSCAPTLSRRKFADPALQQGPEAQALLDVLDAFSKPTSLEAAVTKLRAKVPPPIAREAVEHLTASRFLRPV